jgi:aspartyl-tRNA(Asn)/glutamyl-tRNA(Gln) amidotransferase subunit C
MDLTRDQVERVARLARLALNDREIGLFARQLGEVLMYMERLAEVPTDDVEPTSHVVDLENVMRDDLPQESLPQADALCNAPETRADLFIVPPVIEGGSDL